MSALYPSDKAILLFDGVCFSCNAVVDTVIRSDKKDQFRFVPQQSELGQAILKSVGIEYSPDINTMALIFEGKVYRYSSAYFQMCRILKGLWTAGLIFSVLPRSFTDACYLFYSKRRHAFGKPAACRIPSPQEKAKFLS
jgi:predicted DCC family thiol-disulfide oxidoreductase YuxK